MATSNYQSSTNKNEDYHLNELRRILMVKLIKEHVEVTTCEQIINELNDYISCIKTLISVPTDKLTTESMINLAKNKPTVPQMTNGFGGSTFGKPTVPETSFKFDMTPTTGGFAYVPSPIPTSQTMNSPFGFPKPSGFATAFAPYPIQTSQTMNSSFGIPKPVPAPLFQFDTTPKPGGFATVPNTSPKPSGFATVPITPPKPNSFATVPNTPPKPTDFSTANVGSKRKVEEAGYQYELFANAEKILKINETK